MTQCSKPVGPGAGDAITCLYGRSNAVIGVVHLVPLAGAPRYRGEAVKDVHQQGLDGARAYLDDG